MKNKHYKKISLCAFGIWAAGSAVFAAGFQVQEQGASNVGTAMAGAVVNANNDASAAYHNPSAAAFLPVEKGTFILNAAISAVIPTLAYKDGAGYEASCAKNAYVPNGFGVYKINDSLTATFSMTAPYGLESKYDSDWRYADQGIHSYLMTFDLNPSLVYKVNEWFSISGGVSAQYAYCKLTQLAYGSELKMSGDSWGVGGNIGFTIAYAPDGRIGFQWRSSVDHTLEGSAKLGGTKLRNITADVTMPDTFTVGIYQRLRGCLKEFAVMADYMYTRWSTFDELAVSGFPAVEEDWKDTSRVGVGVHYYPEYFKDDLTIRFGAAFDESPVRSPEMRTVRIPCTDRVWFACGVGYKWDNISFDVGYSYIMTVGNHDINRKELTSTAVGSYYGHIHVVSLQVGYQF